jgi:hypothetical protein
MGKVIMFVKATAHANTHSTILILQPLPSRSKFGVHPARLPLCFPTAENQSPPGVPAASAFHQGCSLSLDLICYYYYYFYPT